MPLAFTRSGIDHASLQRTDPDWIAARAADRDACAILFAGGDLAADEPGGPALTVHPSKARAFELKRPGLVFIGVQNGRAWFAAALERGQAEKGPNFRVSAIQAGHDFACIAGRARAILQWHARRRYCSNCAGENETREGGLKLVCASCGMEHFPRVDPSVIMLPYAGDRCVMGRQASWPEGLYATLAGFIEPGETIEEACARETAEEIGLTVRSAVYVGSQPWPFPSSLMIGLMAEIEPGELKPDDDLEDARWFTRDEVRALYDGPAATFAPADFSISRLLIDRWLDGAV